MIKLPKYCPLIKSDCKETNCMFYKDHKNERFRTCTLTGIYGLSSLDVSAIDPDFSDIANSLDEIAAKIDKIARIYDMK